MAYSEKSKIKKLYTASNKKQKDKVEKKFPDSKYPPRKRKK